MIIIAMIALSHKYSNYEIAGSHRVVIGKYYRESESKDTGDYKQTEREKEI